MDNLVASVEVTPQPMEEAPSESKAITSNGIVSTNGVHQKKAGRRASWSNGEKSNGNAHNAKRKRTSMDSEEGAEDNEESTDGDSSEDEEGGVPLESDALIALTNLEFGSPNSKRKRSSDDRPRELADPEEWKPVNGKKRKKKKKASEQSQRKSKWLVAAVQVLTEESEKGIYAMGVSQIWTKIRDAGLMDFQGKTPRNSLSSALSAAKSKGSNSIIVYNEGLYALRKYKHKLEEGRVKNICWETLPEDDSPRQMTNSQWVGGSIYKKGNRTYYGAVRVEGIVYRVGETAHFASPNDSRPSLGHIAAMYEDDKGVFVESIWYLYPEDTHFGRSEEHLKDEVFMSDSRDTNSIDSLETKAEVLCATDFNKRAKQGLSLKSVYVCKAYYDWEAQKYLPFKHDEDLKTTILNPLATFNPAPPAPMNGHPQTNGHGHGEDVEVKIEKKRLQGEREGELSSKGGGATELERALKQIAELQRENEQLRKRVASKMTGDKPLPKNWPVDLTYTPSPIWDTLEAEMKHKVYLESMLDVEIRKTTEEPAGENAFGLFARRVLAKGTVVGEYSGFVQVKANAASKIRSTVLFKDEADVIEINAENGGNETRFINDCGIRNSGPNVTFQKMKIGGCNHVVVVAIKDIMVDQELLADYAGIDNQSA